MKQKRARKPTKCLSPDCGADATKRGVCDNCHQIYRRAINEEETTDQELVAKGLLLPPQREMTPARRALAAMKS